VPSGPAWLAKPTSTNLHALEGCPPRPAGTGARLSAHEIASTLTGHHLPAADQRARPRNRAWSQMWSHSPPSGCVRRRPRAAYPRRSRTVAAIGERRSALLESVLGATPREFESRILRHADLRQCDTRVLRIPRTGTCGGLNSGLKFRASGRPLQALAIGVVPGHGGGGRVLNGVQHAAEACALPFRAGRHRPRDGRIPAVCDLTICTSSGSIMWARVGSPARTDVYGMWLPTWLERVLSRRYAWQLDLRGDRPVPRRTGWSERGYTNGRRSASV